MKSPPLSNDGLCRTLVTAAIVPDAAACSGRIGHPWQSDGRAETQADAFVAFGITGDLAKVMTFRSLYRLERRGLLDCPIVGVAVDDWTLPHLRSHMRQAIVASGEKLEKKVFDRLAARLSYVSGDFADPATYERLRETR